MKNLTWSAAFGHVLAFLFCVLLLVGSRNFLVAHQVLASAALLVLAGFYLAMLVTSRYMFFVYPVFVFGTVAYFLLLSAGGMEPGWFALASLGSGVVALVAARLWSKKSDKNKTSSFDIVVVLLAALCAIFSVLNLGTQPAGLLALLVFAAFMLLLQIRTGSQFYSYCAAVLVYLWAILLFGSLSVIPPSWYGFFLILLGMTLCFTLSLLKRWTSDSLVIPMVFVSHFVSVVPALVLSVWDMEALLASVTLLSLYHTGFSREIATAWGKKRVLVFLRRYFFLVGMFASAAFIILVAVWGSTVSSISTGVLAALLGANQLLVGLRVRRRLLPGRTLNIYLAGVLLWIAFLKLVYVLVAFSSISSLLFLILPAVAVLAGSRLEAKGRFNPALSLYETANLLILLTLVVSVFTPDFRFLVALSFAGLAVVTVFVSFLGGSTKFPLWQSYAIVLSYLVCLAAWSLGSSPISLALLPAGGAVSAILLATRRLKSPAVEHALVVFFLACLVFALRFSAPMTGHLEISLMFAFWAGLLSFLPVARVSQKYIALAVVLVTLGQVGLLATGIVFLYLAGSATGVFLWSVVLGATFLVAGAIRRDAWVLAASGFCLFVASALGVSLLPDEAYRIALGLACAFALHGLARLIAVLSGKGIVRPLDFFGYLIAAIFVGHVLLFSPTVTLGGAAVPLITASVLYGLLAAVRKTSFALFMSVLCGSASLRSFLRIASPDTQLMTMSLLIVSGVCAGVGLLLKKRGKAAAAAALCFASGTLVVLSGIAALDLEHTTIAAITLLIGGLIALLLLFITGRDSAGYLISLAAGLLLLRFVSGAGDGFNEDFFHPFIYALVAISFLFFLPQIVKFIASLRISSLFIVKNWRGALLLFAPLLLLVLGLSVSAYAVLVVTKNPYFCGTCHATDPFFASQYDSWAESKHKDVSCDECHYPPGLEGMIQGKIDGARHATKFATRSFGPKDHDVIDDAACLREGCHSVDKLLAQDHQYTFKDKASFRFKPHIGTPARGISLKCVSCHAHKVDGTHFEVDAESCFICHFKGRGEKETAIGSCQNCHGLPKAESFDHADFFSGGIQVSCTGCHSDVVKGAGNVAQERCVACHAEPSRIERYKDMEFVHNKHVSEESVTCSECHEPIIHSHTKHIDLSGSCTKCHPGQHATSLKMLEGKGGLEVVGDKAPMAKYSVTCFGCHTERHKSPAVRRKAARSSSCIECHGDEDFGEMTQDWQSDARDLIEEVESALESARSMLADAKGKVSLEKRKELSSVLERAAFNLAFVKEDRSYGVHNPEYTESLLESVRTDCEKVVEEFSE